MKRFENFSKKKLIAVQSSEKSGPFSVKLKISGLKKQSQISVPFRLPLNLAGKVVVPPETFNIVFQDYEDFDTSVEADTITEFLRLLPDAIVSFFFLILTVFLITRLTKLTIPSRVTESE